MKCSYALVLLVVMVFAIIAPAGAVDLDLTFESPTYSVGDLVGQDGWEGVTNSMDVWDVMPLSGLQSVTLTGYPNRVTRSISSVTFDNNTQISWLQRINHADGIIVVGTMDDPYTSNAVYLFTNGGTVNALSGADWVNIAPYSLEDVIQIKVNLDFTNFKQKVTVINQTNPNNSAATDWISFGDNWAGATAFGGKILLAGRHAAAGTDSMIDDLKIAAGPVPASVTAHVTPGSFIGNPSLSLFKLELLQGGTVVHTKEAKLNPDNYIQIADVAAGNYDVAVSGTYLLRRVVNQQVTAGQDTLVEMPLPGGDVDGDGEITSDDLTFVADNIGLTAQ